MVNTCQKVKGTLPGYTFFRQRRPIARQDYHPQTLRVSTGKTSGMPALRRGPRYVAPSFAPRSPCTSLIFIHARHSELFPVPAPTLYTLHTVIIQGESTPFSPPCAFKWQSLKWCASYPLNGLWVIGSRIWVRKGIYADS